MYHKRSEITTPFERTATIQERLHPTNSSVSGAQCPDMNEFVLKWKKILPRSFGDVTALLARIHGVDQDRILKIVGDSSDARRARHTFVGQSRNLEGAAKRFWRKYLSSEVLSVTSHLLPDLTCEVSHLPREYLSAVCTILDSKITWMSEAVLPSARSALSCIDQYPVLARLAAETCKEFTEQVNLVKSRLFQENNLVHVSSKFSPVLHIPPTLCLSRHEICIRLPSGQQCFYLPYPCEYYKHWAALLALMNDIVGKRLFLVPNIVIHHGWGWLTLPIDLDRSTVGEHLRYKPESAGALLALLHFLQLSNNPGAIVPVGGFPLVLGLRNAFCSSDAYCDTQWTCPASMELLPFRRNNLADRSHYSFWTPDLFAPFIEGYKQIRDVFTTHSDQLLSSRSPLCRLFEGTIPVELRPSNICEQVLSISLYPEYLSDAADREFAIAALLLKATTPESILMEEMSSLLSGCTAIADYFPRDGTIRTTSNRRIPWSSIVSLSERLVHFISSTVFLYKPTGYVSNAIMQYLHPVSVSNTAVTSQSTYSQVLHLIQSKGYRAASQLCTGKQVLDWGCNDGYGLKILSKAASACVGVDICSAAIEIARNELPKNVELTVISGAATPFPAQSFDIITAFQLIEHCYDPLEVVQEMVRILRPSGVVMCSTPNALIRMGRPGSSWNPFHAHEYTARELRELLQRMFKYVEVIGLFGDSRITNVERGRISQRKKSLHANAPESLMSNTFSDDDLFFSSQSIDNALDLYALCSFAPLEPYLRILTQTNGPSSIPLEGRSSGATTLPGALGRNSQKERQEAG